MNSTLEDQVQFFFNVFKLEFKILNRENSDFIDFLSSDTGSQISRENIILIHMETGNSFYNYNTGESRRKQKKVHATLTYKKFIFKLHKIFSGQFWCWNGGQIWCFYKHFKYPLYRFKNYFLFRGLSNNPVRHLKIVKNEIIMKEVQNRDWQYLVESVIKLAENDKSHLKPLSKNWKKEIYRVPWRVYAFTYSNITKQISLPPYKTDGIENYRKGNGLLSVQDTESATEWFDSLTMFYDLNGKLPNYRRSSFRFRWGNTTRNCVQKTESYRTFC